jgi:hypothetical protein
VAANFIEEILMTTAIQHQQFLAGEPSRYNIYVAVHKGLRGFMVDTLTQLGKVDVADECEFTAVIEQVSSLLETCLSHVHNEDTFLHPVMDRTRANSASATEHEHAEHLHAIDALQRQVAQLGAALPSARAFLTRSLYLRMSRFVADNFAHMVKEETENHEVLIAALSDAELLQIESAIVASHTPEQNMLFLRWMLLYMNTGERIFALRGMKQGMPPEVFQGVLEIARNNLSQRDFFKLEHALA